MEIEVSSEGIACASGGAALPTGASPLPDFSSYERRTPPALADRPPADESSLATGTPLATVPAAITTEAAAQYLRDVRETLPIYAHEGIVHPGVLLRLCNAALRENVVLAPWIHTGSQVHNFAIAKVGDTLEARARVAANYERKGHRLVELDTLLLANGKPIAHVVHTAVYRLRHLSAA
jgi:hypothetical protein